MKHEDIWRALDTLAAEHGLSASGLAKRAGLDPTTFNPSKRRMPDGRARWPGTESVAKVLDATGATLEQFTALVSGARALASNTTSRATVRRIPLIGLAQAGGDGFFDDGGYPVGGGWDEVSFADPPGRPRRGPHNAGGGHGEGTRPPVGPADRAAQPEPAAPPSRLRPERGGLGAPHPLGQPVIPAAPSGD